MRIALVSPYSWTYPGGVTRHIEALAGELLERGHEVRVLSPFDRDDRRTATLHRGARPAARDRPPYLVDLGSTVGFPANGAVSNVALTPSAVFRLRHELRTGGFDVVHLHEPVAAMPCWDALTVAPAPLVGTFHCYSENPVTNGAAVVFGARRRLNRLRVRIAVSEAAAWTGRRFFGGAYRVIPNGVDVPVPAPAPRLAAAGSPLRVAFVGQAVERKGLPVLLRAFEALREHLPVELVLVGVGPEEIAPLLHDPRGVTALGKTDEATKARVLETADVLAAPSLGGESFGMVLTEAFARGTPVVASDIAGYRDVVAHGEDGLLVPKGDATALAETLRDLHEDPARRAALARGAAASAPRYAWPRVADEVLAAYEDAIAVGEPAEGWQRAAVRVGALPADLGPRRPARRLPSLEPRTPVARRPGVALARKAGAVLAGAASLGLTALAVERVGLDHVGETLLRSSPGLVALSLGLMCLSMAVRAVAWHAILRAALPKARVRLVDAAQGTFIGVLMSATLPARLGEPSRAFVVARRTGRPREHLPTVLGTIVSQTLLNLLALVILGAVMFATIGLFDGRQGALFWYMAAPLAIVALVLVVPALIPGGVPSRFQRVQAGVARARGALSRVRSGLAVFRRPRLGATAVVAQLGAWALQWVACYALLVALGLDGRAGIGAAAAVLFAVNVTAVLPVTPSNVGVFQAACVAVLAGAYGVSSADALGYGIVLQLLEVVTAVLMGIPALLKEGLSWREVKLRALHAAPVELAARPAREAA